MYYIIHRAGLSRKLVKIGGSSEPLEPPWLRACTVYIMRRTYSLFLHITVLEARAYCILLKTVKLQLNS